MPRLFTALEIPREVAQSLSFLRGGLPGARWIDTENYHITLRFVGDVDFRTADEFAHGLAKIERSPVTVRLSGLDAFGGNKPHSVHAVVERNAALGDLQSEMERIAQRVGLKAEGRKFLPHVTIARLRGVKGQDVAEYLALRGNYASQPFTATSFVLYSSRDSIGGGPYIVEDRFPLAGRREGERLMAESMRYAAW